ncbi:MAG: penicillin-binding protein 2 [Deltaproteobacteria bacterium]|nr:penicillin-binding protein 2 [Deltaproteobacteria bacterium]
MHVVVALGIGGDRQFGRVRFRVLTAVAGVALAFLVVRLYVLQVKRHQELRQKSESNFIQLRRVAHERGMIRDRERRVLAENRPSHDVFVTPAFLPDARAMLARVLGAAGVARAPREVADAIQKRVGEKDVAPVVIATGLSPSAVTATRAALEATQVAGLDLVPGDNGGTDLVAYPHDFATAALVFRRLEHVLDLPEGGLAEVRKEVARARGLNRFVPIMVKQNLPWDAYARASHAASMGELPGADVTGSVVRRYREGALAAHLLGYMNEVGAQELGELEPQGYLRGDYMGRRGLERSYERTLRGKDGQEKVVVDAKGRRLNDDRARSLLGDDARVEATPGQTLVLALDMDLQRAAEESFRGRAGAVVAVDVATGSILALASFPDYDPNVVSGRMTAAEKRALDLDPLQPWINKAIQQHYAPGSTFKLFTALAGLLESRIGPDSVLPCPGFFQLGRTTWRCFNRFGHGGVALQKSIQVSCDAYYYRLGYNLGADLLSQHAHEFGLGEKTGVPLDGEISGLVADENYYVTRFGSYQGGYVVNNAIGQGDVVLTPLQLAMGYAAIVNGGMLYEPRLVLRTEDKEGRVLHEHPPRLRRKITLPAAGMKEVLTGMSEVVKPGGTAAGVMWKDDPPGLGLWLRTAGVAIGGKTGTAQVARLSKSVQHVEAAKTEYLLRDHAWFAGFAPAEAPEIVVVTLTEHGGFGGSTSAPVSAAVMRAYFEKKGFHARPERDRVRVVPQPVAPAGAAAAVPDAPPVVDAED